MMMVFVMAGGPVTRVDERQGREHEAEDDRREAAEPEPHADLAERATATTTTASRIAGR